ncbi:MAG: asparagine--tRNA ligase [Candidatus Micrarchaeota archaeon]|nr:asparagine--tRNA ligase [Candidatus Micrarchaeota archaeon]
MDVQHAVKREGRKVSLAGWVHRKRESGGIVFIILRDVSGLLQVAIKKDKVDQKSWDSAVASTVESSVKVGGAVRKDDRSPTGYELEAARFRNVHIAEPYPITEYQSTELLLDKRHLWLRSRKMINIMRVRSFVFRYAREFLDRKGFYEVTPPLITKSGGETGANMFSFDYFGDKAYLTESSQLYVEAMEFALGFTYSFAPSFRAENSRTVKHLAEYWHLEPEMPYYDNEKAMKLEERFVSSIANKLAKRHADILKELEVDAQQLLKIKPPFERIPYERAIAILNEKGASKKWGDDFGVEDEKLLTEDKEKPIFVHSWPKEIKPFYMPINAKDPRTVASADMLAPHGHGEIIGSGEREWRLDKLLERMHEVESARGVKFNMQNYEWWLDLRRYGSVPHAGFGMGMERLIKWLLNLDHIRDAIPFPRMSNRLYP